MNYIECECCGQQHEFSTNLQCRNDLLEFMNTKGWMVIDEDNNDKWFCSDCISEGFTIDNKELNGEISYLRLGKGYYGDELIMLSVNSNPITVLSIWYDAEMDNREYVLINSTVYYLDTMKGEEPEKREWRFVSESIIEANSENEAIELFADNSYDFAANASRTEITGININADISTIETALMNYVNDSAGKDSDETKEIQRAWDNIKNW